MQGARRQGEPQFHAFWQLRRVSAVPFGKGGDIGIGRDSATGGDGNGVVHVVHRRPVGAWSKI